MDINCLVLTWQTFTAASHQKRGGMIASDHWRVCHRISVVFYSVLSTSLSFSAGDDSKLFFGNYQVYCYFETRRTARADERYPAAVRRSFNQISVHLNFQMKFTSRDQSSENEISSLIKSSIAICFLFLSFSVRIFFGPTVSWSEPKNTQRGRESTVFNRAAQWRGLARLARLISRERRASCAASHRKLSGYLTLFKSIFDSQKHE